MIHAPKQSPCLGYYMHQNRVLGTRDNDTRALYTASLSVPRHSCARAWCFVSRLLIARVFFGRRSRGRYFCAVHAQVALDLLAVLHTAHLAALHHRQLEGVSVAQALEIGDANHNTASEFPQERHNVMHSLT